MATNKTGFDRARMPEALGEQYQAQVAGVREMVSAIVESAQRLSEIQMTAVRDAQEQQQRVIAALGKPGGNANLTALQGVLFSEMMNGWLQYWTRVAELAQSTQANLARIGQQAASRAMREVKAK